MPFLEKLWKISEKNLPEEKEEGIIYSKNQIFILENFLQKSH